MGLLFGHFAVEPRNSSHLVGIMGFGNAIIGLLTSLVFSVACGQGSIDPVGPVPTSSATDKLSVSPVLFLALDDTNGLWATDASGNDYDGALLNGASFTKSAGDGSLSAVEFDGVDDFIDVGELDVSGSGLTLSAWFSADSFTGKYKDGRLISKATGIQGDDHIFMLSTIRKGSNVRLRGRVRVGGETTKLIARTGNLRTGEWYHAALTYDGAWMRLYLTGAAVGQPNLYGAVDVEPSMSVAVGG